MLAAANPGNRHPTARAWTFLACAALGLALASGGCSGPQVTLMDKTGDPLLGPAPPPGVNPVPAPGHGTAQGSLPPIPPSGLSTNAALASQSPTAHSLSLGNPPAGADSWQRNIQ